jgi:amidase
MNNVRFLWGLGSFRPLYTPVAGASPPPAPGYYASGPVSELMFRSAIELAALVRRGEVSASELVSESLQRIDALDSTISAFTHVAHESALREAASIGAGDPRPFAGVPIAIKDNRPVARMPLTICSDLFGDFVPGHDAFVVRRFREAGFVIVGKTALPEMAILPTTESRRFGPTRNPWALDRTPGGSSGGSAAAVAAGMVPIAHGNDGGGSTRIPAACCGLVGLKGARGRVSVGPDGGQSFLAVDGVLTRTVADTAAVLDVIAGAEPGDASWAPDPDSPFASQAEQQPGGLRIGLALNPALDDAVLDPECERAARAAASLLGSLGHEVEQITPPWSGLGLLSDFTRAFGPLVSLTTLIGGKIAGRDPTEADVEPLTWALWERARTQSTLKYLEAQGRLESLARTLVTWLAPFDFVLTPALARRPLAIGEVHGRGPDPWSHYQRSGQFTPYTAIVNVTGLPAVSLPLYQGEDGLPTAVQLIGRPVQEGALLALCTQLEQTLPWSDRRPPTI